MSSSTQRENSMRKLLLPGAIAMIISGCGGYDAKDLKSSDGERFTPTSRYAERDGGKPANGDVTRTENGVKTLEFSVKDGRVDGKWIGRDEQGNLTQDLELRAGDFVGTSTLYCTSKGDEKKPSRTVVIKSGVRTDTTFDCATGFSLRQIVKVDDRGQPNHNHNVGEQKAWQIVDGKQVLRGVERYASDGSGKLEGLSEVYFPNGAIGVRKEYKAGELNGRSEEYSQLEGGTSRLSEANNYANGKRSGEQLRYFPAPFPEGTVKERQEVENDSEKTLTTFTYGKANVYVRGGTDDYQLVKLLQGQQQGYASQVPDLQGLEYLLTNRKVDINAPLDQQGNAPIHVAAENAYELMLTLGADASKQTFNGQNRLMRCLTNEINCSADHVLRLAAEPAAKQVDLYGNTPLHLLCRSAKFMGFREDMRADERLLGLIANQDVNAKDYQGKTALHYCMKKNPQFIDPLVAAGADLDAADFAGITPMHVLFLRETDLETIGASAYQVSWSQASVENAGRLMAHSKFRFDAPFPGFPQGLKQLMIENGDAQSAMTAERVTPKA